MQNIMRQTQLEIKSPIQMPFLRFMILWVGQVISGMGSSITIFVLGIYLLKNTQTVSHYTLALFCGLAPFIIAAPFCGILADRYERRHLILISDMIALMNILYLCFSIQQANWPIGQVYLSIVLGALCNALRTPAYKAAVSDLLQSNDYSRASGLLQLANSLQYIVAPLMASILMTYLSLVHFLWIDAISFVVAIVCTLCIYRHFAIVAIKTPSVHLKQNLLESWQVFAAHRGLIDLLMFVAAILFFVGLIQALFSPLILSTQSPKTLGWLQSVCGSGLILGSFFIGMYRIRNLVRILSVALGAMGLFYIALGISTQITLIAISGILFFLTLPFINMAIDVLIRQNVPNQQQGRIWALIGALTHVGSLIAFSVAGFLADQIFNPLLLSEGGLVQTWVGDWLGVGAGRGIGLLFVCAGICVIGLASLIICSKSIRTLN